MTQGRKLLCSWGWGCFLQDQNSAGGGPAWPSVPQAFLPPIRGSFIEMDTKGTGARSPASGCGWGKKTGEEGPVLPDEQRAGVVRELCYSPNCSFPEMPGYSSPLSAASAESPSLGQEERVPLSLTDTNCSGFWLTTKPPMTPLLFPSHS